MHYTAGLTQGLKLVRIVLQIHAQQTEVGLTSTKQQKHESQETSYFRGAKKY